MCFVHQRIIFQGEKGQHFLALAEEEEDIWKGVAEGWLARCLSKQTKYKFRKSSDSHCHAIQMFSTSKEDVMQSAKDFLDKRSLISMMQSNLAPLSFEVDLHSEIGHLPGWEWRLCYLETLWFRPPRRVHFCRVSGSTYLECRDDPRKDLPA